MKIDHIHKEHIEEASKFIDTNGIPSKYQKNIYWVRVNEKEYPFKYLIRIAHQLTKGHSNEWLDFQSKQVYRNYIEDLGLDINSYQNRILFFTAQDIRQLSDVARRTYDSENTEHHKFAENLKNNAWEKTKYWFNQVIAELDDFTGICKKVWSQRGWDNGVRVSTFKPYTWARIFREDDFGKDIYFTVGVDGESAALVYKLDYQFEGKTVLTYEQKQICKQLIKKSPASWVEIPIDELQNYTWDRLIEETVTFIENYKKLYDKVVEQVWGLNQKRIARLSFNTNGWIMPSGPYGKSSHSDSHEANYGYGHEEWLFDTSKLIDGFHYGFLEPIRKQQDAYSGNTYNVWLYTIDGDSKKRFWVGEINNLEVLNRDQANNIKSIYEERGWLKEMEEQIKASGANLRGFSDWYGVDLFNVRYKPVDLVVNDPYFELSPNHPIYEQSRYTFAHFKEDYFVEEGEESDNFEFTLSSEESYEDEDTSVKTETHQREPKTIEITYLHKAISNNLTKVLKEKYGKLNVQDEHPSGIGGNRVDIIVKSKDEGLIFYEIKTYNSLKTSIREALGQLIEYSMWPDKNKASQFVILTQKHENIEKAKVYFHHLRESFGIPIYYQWFDIVTKELSEKY